MPYISLSHLPKYGLIILGNSGVGKSFLANILLGKEVFQHKFSSSSVTHETESYEVQLGETSFAVFNIPGLIEADQNRIDLNKQEIYKAFDQRPNSIIIYVFGNTNGRIRDEDFIAFNAINKAFPFNEDSLVIAINSLPKKRPENYEGEATVKFQQYLRMKLPNLCFLNQINEDNQSERERLREKLLHVTICCRPEYHVKQQEIKLNADEISELKEGVRKQQEAYERQKAQFQNQIDKAQQKYAQLEKDRQSDIADFEKKINSLNKNLLEANRQHYNEIASHQKEINSLSRKLRDRPNPAPINNHYYPPKPSTSKKKSVSVLFWCFKSDFFNPSSNAFQTLNAFRFPTFIWRIE
ncbi:unnamed protein product [Didymodactylos carnosus]|uniref:AIG1-type G domain-containing protein n=1 Tax=Didymodactylos carnosus TaxID=1234261 RepID=A0A8S2JMB7_9BILA|nr:unnamed protein product [Didymodactylos carnosus]CAF3816689.1 unnamed protein product [Didymodactylos carnosus]